MLRGLSVYSLTRAQVRLPVNPIKVLVLPRLAVFSPTRVQVRLFAANIVAAVKGCLIVQVPSFFM